MTEYIITGEQLERLGVPDMFTEQEIVRCRDCRHYYPHDHVPVCYRLHDKDLYVEPDGFCKWAERRGK